MSKKDTALLMAMALGMMSSSPSLYGGLQRASRPEVTKCAECPKFRRGCPCSNGEMKPCSKYR